MKSNPAFFLFFVLFLALQSCNTLYNSKTIDIEILVPGKARIPDDYKKLVVQYNNCNVSWNADFAQFYEDTTTQIDYSNSDSIASFIYCNAFIDYVLQQDFFDTIIALVPIDFSGVVLNDSLVMQKLNQSEIPDSVGTTSINTTVLNLSRLAKNLIPPDSSKTTSLLIHPEFGLYTKNRIEKIAGETQADLLLSLDFFAVADGIYSAHYLSKIYQNRQLIYNYRIGEASEIVYVMVNWYIYDLKKKELTGFFNKIDTINWNKEAYSIRYAKKVLPPRTDAVYNAAAIAGTNLAQYLSPHWINVQRMYYQSGQTELKKTNDLVANNQWLEAAEIWKRNVNNKNKKIAAKSMYNMALVCEMNGELDAAMDWAVKSYHTFGNKNETHAYNCKEYIKIIAQRKLDIAVIER